jgi:DNA gyrase subunit B
MPELVSRGHIYIAQPPLYKIKRGKSERYLKDETELNAYLLEAALEDAALEGTPGKPALSGEALARLCHDYLAVENTIRRLSRRYDAKLLKGLVYLPTITPESLKDEKRMTELVAILKKRLKSEENGARFEVSLGTNSHSGGHEILVTRSEHGAVTMSRVDGEFVSSGEYRSIRHLGAQLDGLIQDGALVRRGEHTNPVTSFDDAFQWLMEQARRGQTIQRYKGLGEMNPEQLWETTMDVKTRRLLKVNIEDGVAADEIFTTLMGDQVEPRRDFIERNALYVANLDI